MITREGLYGKFVKPKGRNKEAQELANNLGFRCALLESRETAKYLIFTNEYYDTGSLEYTSIDNYCKHYYTEITVEELLGETMKEYKVSEQFIKEAHKAACSTWRTKLEEQFPEVFPKTYCTGARFTKGSYEYMLVQVDSNECCLINLTNGNRVREAISVENNQKVTQREMSLMACDWDKFKLKN